MTVHWRAVLAGIVTTIALGLLSGATVPFTDVSLPVLGTGLSGVAGGAVAGYVSGADYTDGALNGGISTAIGWIVVIPLLALGGLFASPLASLGILAFGLVLIVVAAIPGVAGGVLGAWVKRRTRGRPREEPAAP